MSLHVYLTVHPLAIFGDNYLVFAAIVAALRYEPYYVYSLLMKLQKIGGLLYAEGW